MLMSIGGNQNDGGLGLVIVSGVEKDRRALKLKRNHMLREHKLLMI